MASYHPSDEYRRSPKRPPADTVYDVCPHASAEYDAITNGSPSRLTRELRTRPF